QRSVEERGHAHGSEDLSTSDDRGRQASDIGGRVEQWCVLGSQEAVAVADSDRHSDNYGDSSQAESQTTCPLCTGDAVGTTGSWCLTRFSLNEETAEAGEVWLVLASDMSEQQQLYRELAARNADLAHLNRLKDEFLACISHELKSPLTAIVGLSNLLQNGSLGSLNERQDRYARLIHQSGRKLAALVTDILDLTRLESGQLVLHPSLTNIQAACQQAHEDAQIHAASQLPTRAIAEIPFSLDIEIGLETLEADEHRLQQILTHLLSNALKFTKPDGRVGLRVSRWEGWIAFTVWDTGIGIPAALQHLIFQKFQQLETPLTREHEGTGLGLVLAQRLARAHGGDISFVSEVDRGSEFTLLLPPFPPPTAATRAPQQEAIPARLRPHTSLSTLVLIVETVPQYIDRLARLLQQLGYRAAIARSSTEAIAKARTLQPRAILLNPFLSPLSGWDVLTLLKSDPHTRQIPTFVMASRAERQPAEDRGADRFLTLPVSERALQESLSLSSPTRSAPIHRQNLTVLRLECGGRREFVPPLETALGNLSGQLNCRILEAEDLEQAGLLARIWHPNAVLLDSGGQDVPMAYLRQLSACRPVAALPLIVLDAQVAQTAHELGSLTVFPCLIEAEANPAEAVWSAIQVAAGIELSAADAAPHILIANGRGDRAAADNSWEWLQALVQYLATAGYRSSLAQSWAEVRSQIQGHGIDLLLLDLGQIPEASVLAIQRELELLLGGELGVSAIVLAQTPESPAGKALAAQLKRLAARVLLGHPQSMADLLIQIERLLE
ncbi:MAG: hybrid sensor histidine kinase/response regulator, partial [Cyanobacteria bacterium J06641_5]